jgi:O-antigen ligase
MSAVARTGRVAGAAFAIALALVAAAGALALLAQVPAVPPVVVAAGVAIAVVAWLRPVAAAAVLLAAAPLFGDRPTTTPFVACAWLTACAVPGWLARLAGRDRRHLVDLVATPVGLALAVYAGVSVLSLTSLPIHAPADLVGTATAGQAFRELPARLLAADVTFPIYPLLTVILTLHALVAALTVGVAVRRDAAQPGAAGRIDAATLIASAILAGLAIALAAGALDRAGLADLRHLRTPDPFTNITGAERLQSTFGHAGWFAEYLCFATPSILAVWLWPRLGRLARTGLALVLVAATFAAIVLSYQRGGWLTWAVVGGGVTVAIVHLARKRVDGAASGTLPVRRLAMLAAGLLIVGLPAALIVIRLAAGPGAIDRFAFRARTITQVSDRQAHVTAGLRLGALLPVLGGGSESFAMRYEQEYLLAGGRFYARGQSPLLGMYGSAHNVFAQTFAGKGAAGLVALLAIVATALLAAWRVLRKADSDGPVGVVAAVVLGTTVAFALYGQVQEVFYVAPLQLTLFAVWGMAAAIDRSTPRAAFSRLGVAAAVLGVVLAAHLVQGYVSPGLLAEAERDRAINRAGERLSAPVRADDGEYFQWTGPRAFVTVPRQATQLTFEVKRRAAVPTTIEVRFDDRIIDRLTLVDDDWRRVVYPLQRVHTLPRRLVLVVTTGAPAADAAVRRLRWGLP